MLLPNGIHVSITCTWILVYIAWAVVLRDLFWIRWYHLSKKMCDANIYIARKNNRQVLFNEIWGKCKNLLSLSPPFSFENQII